MTFMNDVSYLYSVAMIYIYFCRVINSDDANTTFVQLKKTLVIKSTPMFYTNRQCFGGNPWETSFLDENDVCVEITEIRTST